MKSPLFTLTALLAASLLARADIVIVQRSDAAGQTGDQTIRIKGDKARTDIADQMTMLTDGATGDIVTLVHPQKTYMKISSTQTKAMMEQMQKLRPSAETPKLVPSNRKEKVGDYDCEVFTCNLGMVNITYWIAKDFPNYQAVLAQMEKMQAGSISAMAKGMMPDLKDFPGMTIKTEMEFGGKKVTTTLVSAREENVDPAIFTIPADYKEMAAPTMSLPSSAAP